MSFDLPHRRRVAASASAVASLLLVAGCMSSPTYGTDKTANEQLMEDVSNVFKPLPDRKEQIAYAPRPELVRPEGARNAPLPPPQEAVASAENPDWPESPEQRRARVRAEADANRDNNNFRPEVVSDPVQQTASTSLPKGNGALSPRYRDGTDQTDDTARRAEIKRRIAEQNQGSPNQRKYLSEPPIEYRQPSENATVGDVGEDEWKKERRLKAEARKKSGKSSWRDYIPGL